MTKLVKHSLALLMILISGGELSAQPNGQGKYGGYERRRYPDQFQTPPPNRRHVWVSEEWDYRRGRYVYVPGRWEIPPKKHLYWRSGRWEHSRQGRVWRKGYWAKSNGDPYMPDWGYSDRRGYYNGRDYDRDKRAY